MTINFISNYATGPGGEEADECHLTKELEALSNTVIRVPRDVWKAYCDGYPVQADWILPQKANITIICKWHHFDNEKYIKMLQAYSPVFYWCWDPMIDDYPKEETGEWHLMLARNADLYLSGELGRAAFYKKQGVRFYYFQMDVVSKEFRAIADQQMKYDVVFMGSASNKRGRLDLLKAINRQVPIQIFGYDQIEWMKQGFKNALPAVYGKECNEVIAKSKIILGVSYDPHCFGYWSNRIGRVLSAGGFLLQQYAPGMEIFLGDSCAYFQTADEAILKIKEYLALPHRREEIRRNNTFYNRYRWNSATKMRQLQILIKRFLAENNGKDWLLP